MDVLGWIVMGLHGPIVFISCLNYLLDLHYYRSLKDPFSAEIQKSVETSIRWLNSCKHFVNRENILLVTVYFLDTTYGLTATSASYTVRFCLW